MGIPAGEVNPIFKDAASWNLGYITEHTALPDKDAEIGARALNTGEYEIDRFMNAVRNGIDLILRRPNHGHGVHHRWPDGPFGMDAGDATDFEAGVRSAQLSGFHKAVLHDIRVPPGPVAPIRTTKRTKKSAWRCERHAGGDNAHAIFMEAMPDLPMPIMAPAGLKQANDPPSSGLRYPGPGGLPRALASVGSGLPLFAVFQSHEGASMPNAASDPGGFQDTVRKAMNNARHHQVSTRGRKPDLSIFSGSWVAADHSLPSVAPIRRFAEPSSSPSEGEGDRAFSEATLSARARPPVEPSSIAKTIGKPDAAAAARPNTRLDRNLGAMDEPRMSRALMELLDRQGRLPPSGATGFDPRLTPAWAGQKLPG
jgi:hypothetical protein